MHPKVVVVGSFVQDLSWKCEGFPGPGETVIGRFASGPGGKGSNQAVASGRAGVPTLFVGAVGADGFAREAARFYRSEGIAARFVVKRGYPTATAAVLVNADGQNEIVVALGASERLAPRDIPLPPIRRASIVVCQHEASLSANAFVFRTARRSGAATLLNPAPMRRDFDPGILALTDILVPNESECLALAARLPACRAWVRRRLPGLLGPLGVAELERMEPRLLNQLCRRMGVPTVVVTLGRRGCLVSQGEDAFTLLPAHEGIRVVDTTGAGDAFIGGFAAGFVQHSGDMVAAARLGNAVAALSITKFGTAPSMPTQAQTRRFLAGRP